MLGTVARDHVERLVELLAAADSAALMRYAHDLEQWAPDHAQLLDELAALLTRIALRQVVPDAESDEVYPPELIERLARALAPEDVQLYYQTAIVGRRDLPLAPDPRTGFEMTLLRMIAFRPAADSATLPGPAAARSTGGVKPATLPAASTSVSASALGASTSAPGASVDKSADRPADAPAPEVAAAPAGEWASVVAQLDLQGPERTLASHCALIGRQGGVVRLALDPRNPMVRTRSREEKLAQALTKHYGEPTRLEFATSPPPAETPAQALERTALAQTEAARQALDDDPTVRALREQFGATLVPETVRPVK